MINTDVPAQAAESPRFSQAEPDARFFQGRAGAAPARRRHRRRERRPDPRLSGRRVACTREATRGGGVHGTSVEQDERGPSRQEGSDE